MLARCRERHKKTFGGESWKPLRKVFRKPKRLGFSE
jgi:hypothetical protein